MAKYDRRVTFMASKRQVQDIEDLVSLNKQVFSTSSEFIRAAVNRQVRMFKKSMEEQDGF